MTTTTNSNNLIEDYSFELNYSKLIKIITDFEPFEPFWNSIKELEPIDYLSGLPSSFEDADCL
ncbi:hypothetical protein PCANC_18124 [Puccinia coronata f. sp. avenae]|uniref:Uncharacterized protein n=1 Tax=Puccinia coronata f. sp. avenae TaxID=200324 RepID=A0A2N5SL55_9BASI|nr:hypothetical protein PCANC_18124 [Puccinia coronata f. sp. avenae]